MKTYLIVAISILVLFLLLIFPFRSRFQGIISLDDLGGAYSVKVLCFQILLGRFKLKLSEGLTSEVAVNKLYHADTDPKGSLTFNKILLKHTSVAKVNIITKIGLFDAKQTALCAGTALAISSVVSSVVLSCNPNANVFYSVLPDFDNFSGELIVALSLQISIFKIILSLIEAKKESKNVR